MESEYVAITLLKKVLVSQRISTIASGLILFSVLFFIPIIFNLIPSEFEVDYRGTEFIKENIYWIIGNTILFTVGVLMKLFNYRKVFVLVKFYNDRLIISNRFKQITYKLQDIELIEYKFSNKPEDLVIEKEKHWITIMTKENKELYSEFIGNSIQMDLIEILSEYKDKGINIKIGTIFK